MPARVLVFGLDAADTELLNRWMASGDLPTLARLAAQGSTAGLANPLDTLPGSVWPSLNTGIAPRKVGHYFSHDQIRTGEARLRRIKGEEVDVGAYYWSQASDAGKRVAVIDAVHSFRSPGLNGIQLVQWGLHDRAFEIGSEPPELLEEIHRLHGPYQARCSDMGYAKTQPGFEELLADLTAGARRKTKIALDLLRRESWDLFSVTYSEHHCAGHQFWHFHDPDHPQYDPQAPEALREAIRSIYAEVDRALAEVVEAAGAEVTAVVTSHGMGPLVGGYNLLPEILTRLGMSSDRGAASKSRLRTLQNRLKDRTPKSWVPFMQRVAKVGPLKRFQESMGGMVFPLESSKTRAAQLPNNRVGAIRLNQEGREPNGCVALGADWDALVDEIRMELLALENPDNGEKIVERVLTAEQAFGPDYHPDNPDLLVVFRQDVGQIDRCVSPRVGLIEAPARNARVPRTGDHRGETRAWFVGEGIEPGAEIEGGAIEDFAPTLLALLGVEPRKDLDGKPLRLS
ncbi:MAG: alkaline phosphatase family protein [Acidobacteria bacterium]|nr:alkaline phosphatase family protein [Acidobacteriota bacterium]